MIKERENYDFKLIKIEEGIILKYKLVFYSPKIGEFPVEMKNKNYKSFKFLNNYTGILRINNFDEIKNKKGNIWINYNLESILEKDKVIWKK